MDNSKEINEGTPEGQSFADLLEKYSSGGGDDLEIGDRIECTIISISDDSVIVDTGTKLDGVVEKIELTDERGLFRYKNGDKLELYVISKLESEVHLSRALTGAQSYRFLEDAFERGIPVEGRVKLTCKGGFEIDIMKKRAFCPISQIDLNYVEEPEKYVNQVFSFLITTYETKGKNIVVSRRKILERELEETRKKLLENVKPGAQISGTVTRIMPFGVFVELVPGLEGLIPQSEVSWSRSAKIEDLLKIGDQVTTEVLNIEPGKKPHQLKISLSLKRLLPTPWEKVAETIKTGHVLRGKVTRCRDFGVFVEIEPGVEGLVHISEMNSDQRDIRPDALFKVGQEIEVMVKDIDLPNRRMSLSVKEAEADLWTALKNKYQVGTRCQGIVTTIDKYDLIVTLEDGFLGHLPKKQLTKSTMKKLDVGQLVPVIISEIVPHERMIKLDLGGSTETIDVDSYQTNEAQPSGELGTKLLQALKNQQRKQTGP